MDVFADVEKLIGVSTMFLVSLPCVCVNSWAIYVVCKNQKLSQTVRLFFVTEHILRVAKYLNVIFFTTTCAYTFFCEQTESFTIGWFVNRLDGYLYSSIGCIFNFLALAISANRFFAVFIDGRFYRLATTGAYMQVFVIVFVPLLCLSPQMLDGEAFYYDPYSFGWWADGDIAASITSIINVVDISVWSMVICLDSTTAFLIRRKLIVFSHSITFAFLKVVWIFESQSMWENISDLDAFWFYDLLPNLIDLSAGIARLYFLRQPKKTKIAQLTDTASRKLFSSSVTKTGTSGNTVIVQK